MPTTSRRGFCLLGASALVAAGLVACTTTPNGVTINPAGVLSGASGALQILSTIGAMPAIVALMGASGPTYLAELGVLAAGVHTLQADTASAGGTITLSVDPTSFSTVASSVLGDVQTLAGYVNSAAAALVPGAIATDIANGVAALDVFVVVLKTAISGVFGASPNVVAAQATADALRAKYGSVAIVVP